MPPSKESTPIVLGIVGSILGFFALLFKGTQRVTSPNVESWRPLLEKHRGDIPVEALISWITEESGGNPCAIGAIPHVTLNASQPIENGIFQLYHPDDDHYATPSQLRAACVASANPTRNPGETFAAFKARATHEWQTQTRDLTDEEKEIQVTGGIKLVNHCRSLARAWLASGRVALAENTHDFWNFVKFAHGLPAFLGLLPYLAKKDGPVENWTDFKKRLLELSDEEMGQLAHYRGELPTVFMNAEFVGSRVSF